MAKKLFEEKMTKKEKCELLADRISMALYCYGLYGLGHDIEYIMGTDVVKQSGLNESAVRSLVFDIGPQLSVIYE